MTCFNSCSTMLGITSGCIRAAATPLSCPAAILQRFDKSMRAAARPERAKAHAIMQCRFAAIRQRNGLVPAWVM